ncbi:hypothetical protein F2Q69_00022480 [Brassica cretica]|uniref:Uncharacterized protein n=1 Tax=Brassica cretica TaxID=69181 RepID=A0A8S9QS74_BRACR|nr:hypothetical protein F2Q69_00022480 [Brassica cretica]
MVNKASTDVTSSSQFRPRDVAAGGRSVLLFSIQLVKDRLNQIWNGKQSKARGHKPISSPHKSEMLRLDTRQTGTTTATPPSPC